MVKPNPPNRTYRKDQVDRTPHRVAPTQQRSPQAIPTDMTCSVSCLSHREGDTSRQSLRRNWYPFLLDPGIGSSPEDTSVRSNDAANRPLHSAELARLAGVSTDTLRYYERLRLLPAAPRSTSGYRQFPQQALTRVRLIRGALAIGFSVRELVAIFTERDRGGAPCHRVRALAVKKLAAVEAALRDLRSWRRELKATLAAWDRQLQKTPHGQRAGLLESFVASHPTRQTRSPFVTPLASGHRKRRKPQ